MTTADAPFSLLPDDDVRRIVAERAQTLDLAGKRVLLIVPDDTRTCPIGLMIGALNDAIGPAVTSLDVLIALGTHQPMSLERIYRHLGIDAAYHQAKLPKTRFLNHAWNDPARLKTVGTIPSLTLRELSAGCLDGAIDVKVNSVIFDYDHLIIVGPTFPHEVVGFSGGNKYFFPGIAGPEIIDMFHWLGALITNRRVIGTHYTPVRAVVDHCAAMIDLPKHCFSLVVTKAGLHGIYFGTPEQAYDQAARHSAQVHIKHMPQPFHTVISVCPEMYPELWTAGKCMYKLEPIVAQGGTLVIHGPHLAEVSKTHGHWIEQVGYHVLPYFTSQFEKFRHVPWGVLAHSTHVKGTGRYEGGVEVPDVNVTLATALSPEACRKINLGYRDPGSINLDDYRGREAEGVLVVERAGEVLYRLESDLPVSE
ncbi:MAG: lactate racemase domain-containing protein [Isosphaeraceae bacterium]|nr:lactate racemase domain-containing protein [Isosphaeraceae bacterium]